MTHFPDLITAHALLDGIRDAYEERAAIRQHDGGEAAPEAELAAMAEALGAACKRREAAESAAREAALHAAEEYCDQIRVYDFREMTQPQATEFVAWLIDVYRITLAGAP